MLKKYYPNYYAESIYTINYTTLYNLGYRGIIFDIDNTLVHHGDDSNKEVDNFFQNIHNLGFKTVLLSNNTKERIERFNKNINTLYICDANKPHKEGFNKAINLLNIPKNTIIYIGDQVFVDIIGCNNINLTNILVKYIGYYSEKKIGIKRHLERILLFFYKHSKYYNKLGRIEE